MVETTHQRRVWWLQVIVHWLHCQKCQRRPKWEKRRDSKVEKGLLGPFMGYNVNKLAQGVERIRERRQDACSHQELTQGGGVGSHLKDRCWSESVRGISRWSETARGVPTSGKGLFYVQITEVHEVVSWSTCHKVMHTPPTFSSNPPIIHTFNSACPVTERHLSTS